MRRFRDRTLGGLAGFANVDALIDNGQKVRGLNGPYRTIAVEIMGFPLGPVRMTASNPVAVDFDIGQNAVTTGPMRGMGVIVGGTRAAVIGNNRGQ